MISLRLKLSVYILVAGFLCGFCMAFFFMPQDSISQLPKNSPTATTKQLEKQVATSEKQYRNRIADLQKQNGELQEKLTTTQSLLQQARKSVKQKENSIKKIIQPNKIPPKNWAVENFSIPLFDTEPCECDSLKSEVNSYINENHRKDSIYEIQLATMDSVISVKDSIIDTTEGLYNSLHQIFDKAIATQQVLETENRLLKKKEKRRKMKNRLITAGLLIVSGTIINHFIHH
jgi:hypothetical protein